MLEQAIFDADLIRRYDHAGPRYTSYPTAVQFHAGFGEEAYRDAVATSGARAAPAPLSLYVHIPFCATICYYCACNKVVTRNRAHAGAYLDILCRRSRARARCSTFADRYGNCTGVAAHRPFSIATSARA